MYFTGCIFRLSVLQPGLRYPIFASALKSLRQLSTAALRSGRFSRPRRRSLKILPPEPHPESAYQICQYILSHTKVYVNCFFKLSAELSVACFSVKAFVVDIEFRLDYLLIETKREIFEGMTRRRQPHRAHPDRLNRGIKQHFGACQ